MVSNKKRLYVSLYPSGIRDNAERKYHWAFLIGDKNERGEDVPGKQLHVKNTVGRWVYEELDLGDVQNAVNLLARVLIAKIEDEEHLLAIIRETPVVQDDPQWHCRTWIADVLERLQDDDVAVGTAELDWGIIEMFGRAYVERKRVGGRYSTGADMTRKPLWDLLQNKERIS